MSPKRTSAIKKYFIAIDQSVSKCKLCGNNIRNCGNTTNLKCHIIRKHHNVLDMDSELHALKKNSVSKASSSPAHYKNNFNTDKLPVISSYSSTVEGYPTVYSERGQEQPIICINIPNEASTTAENQQSQISPQINPQAGLSPVNDILHKSFTGKPNELNFCLVETIVKNFLTVQIVESPHFKKFVEKLNKSYQLPNAETVSKVLIPQIYNSAKENLRNCLNDATACAISIDSWTSVSNVTYMSVSAHYIDAKVELKSSLLDCFQYEEPIQSSLKAVVDQRLTENLADELRRIILEWDIDSKIVAIVSDYNANVVSIVEMSGWEHVPCFSHTLNNIILCGLEEVNYVLMKVKSLVDFFKGSPQAYGKLRSMQLELGENSLDLEDDVKMRWNTTYDMLKRILEVKDSIVSTIAIHYPHIENLSSDDLCIIGEICELLKMFKDVNEEICREGEVTASKIILLSQALKKCCMKFTGKNDVSDVVRGLGKKLFDALNDKFDGIEENEVFAEATFLDPRFKRYGFFEEEHFNRVKESLISKANGGAFLNNKQSYGSVKVDRDNVNTSSSVWEEFDVSVSHAIDNTDSTSVGSIEVDKYLAEKMLVRHGDPLSWWLERKYIYPRLFEIAKARLCIVAISTQMFTKTGQIITNRRNHLCSNEVPQILFLSENL